VQAQRIRHRRPSAADDSATCNRLPSTRGFQQASQTDRVMQRRFVPGTEEIREAAHIHRGWAVDNPAAHIRLFAAGLSPASESGITAIRDWRIVARHTKPGLLGVAMEDLLSRVRAARKRLQDHPRKLRLALCRTNLERVPNSDASEHRVHIEGPERAPGMGARHERHRGDHGRRI
jgi:hypothetical protein